MPSEKEDSIGDDAINITQIWTTRQDYLNIECMFYHNNDNSRKHMLSLVVNEAGSDEADSDYVTLEFRHNANQDPTNDPGSAIVSYRLNAISSLLEGKKGLRIRVRTLYDGVKYLEVKFGDDNATEKAATRSANTHAY